MGQTTLRFVVVGHVDHGKSTLIGRLLLDTRSLSREKLAEIRKVSRDLGRDTELAFLTDQLKEEREKNITIDTTRIHFKTRRRRYVIIDAPGHVEFIKNMISGASAAEAAVLIIDAQEGMREQTRRHAYLVRFLGIRRLIAAVNKMDRVGWDRARFEAIRGELSDFLRALGGRAAHVIPISAKTGANVAARREPGMSWYRGPSLLAALDGIDAEEGRGPLPLRLPVQDIYDLEGERWILGKVVGGRLRRGSSVRIFPTGETAVVKTIRGPNGGTQEAETDDNVGILLEPALRAERGFVLTGNPEAGLRRFFANVFWLATEPLQAGGTVLLRCSTQEVRCRIERIENRMNSSTLEILEADAASLGANESATLRFEAERPLFLDPFDRVGEFGRFVVERDLETQGFGIYTGPASAPADPQSTLLK